jgi:hypothetical protein
MGLFDYAKRFADSGFASILIDYANFGGSDGIERLPSSFMHASMRSKGPCGKKDCTTREPGPMPYYIIG